MSTTVQTATDIRPFHVDIPDEELAELRRRIAATRWPSKELVEDRSQGVQSATIQALARYWATDYDWRKAEAKLNALPQFMTEIDGVDIHFIHVKSSHENALPLIMTHGWPGSVMEMLDSVGPLTDPTSNGGSAEDAFHLVLPSLPGYGFSGEPVEVGWDLGPDGTGLGRAHAPPRLHPLRRPGRRRGRRRHRRDGPPGTRGADRHPHEPARSGAERHHADGHRRGTRRGRADRLLRAVRKRLLHRNGHPPADDRLRPARLSRRPGRLDDDHDTDSYYKIARAFVDGLPSGNLTRDNVLDNITAYWLTGTGASAARSYWEAYGPDAPAAGRQPLPPPAIPFGFTTFPGEIWRTPRSWVEASYPNVIYFNEVDRGGHFAAWEEPEIFSSELREAFRSLR